MNEQEAREKAMKRVAMGADSDLTDEQRPHCYKAWSEYQDISEQDVDNRCPDIGDFRVGFIAGWNARGNATEPVDEWVIPPLDEHVVAILGRPNFTCAHIAQILRKHGQEIAEKAEAEQASVIHWLLGVYQRHGADWQAQANATLKAIDQQHGGQDEQ